MCEIVVLQSFFGGSDSITAVLSAARPGLTLTSYFFGLLHFYFFAISPHLRESRSLRMALTSSIIHHFGPILHHFGAIPTSISSVFYHFGTNSTSTSSLWRYFHQYFTPLALTSSVFLLYHWPTGPTTNLNSVNEYMSLF